jgi:hypothetical protein
MTLSESIMIVNRNMFIIRATDVDQNPQNMKLRIAII